MVTTAKGMMTMMEKKNSGKGKMRRWARGLLIMRRSCEEEMNGKGRDSGCGIGGSRMKILCGIGRHFGLRVATDVLGSIKGRQNGLASGEILNELLK